MNTNMQVVSQILLKEAQNGFGNGNFVVSPALLEVMLCMVAVGAKGQTLEQLVSFLGLKSVDDLNMKSASLKVIEVTSNTESSGNLNKREKGAQLCFGNGVWIDKRFPFLPSYKDVLNDIYKAEAKSADFRKQEDQVIEEVNSWIANATKGNLKQILSPGSLGTDTMVLLVNSLYFKGAWDRGFKFDAKLTLQMDFHLLNGTTVSVPFMKREYPNPCPSYGSFNGYKILKIPFQEGYDVIHFSMYFILPDEKDGLQGLIEKFSVDSGLLKQFDLEEDNLYELMIPKFKFSYEFAASDSLKELGLNLPFMAVKELTGIVESPHGDDLYITKIIQQCGIEVSEEGAEAFATTVMRGGGPPPIFIADHPFLFMIKEETSGAVLFVGAVLNPLL